MNNRNTSLDLLRIICMMMVVCLHFFGHGGLVNGTLIPWSGNWLVGSLIYTWSTVAVDCFVLLSGYFQCTSRFKLKRLASVWLQTMFYSAGLYLALALISNTFSVTKCLYFIMPITKGTYWFVTAYFLMYAVSPILNCLIRIMTKYSHLLCCILLLGTISGANNFEFVKELVTGEGVIRFLRFCVFYLTAAYIRLYVPMKSKHGKIGFAIFLICASAVAMEPLPFADVGYRIMQNFCCANSAVLIIAAKIGLLLAMRAVKIRSSGLQEVVGFFAPLSFGVYLIHDHHAVRPLLWGLLNPAGFAQSPWMVPYMFACVIGIFVVCCLVEWCRQKLFRFCGIDQTIAKLSDRIQLKVENWIREGAIQYIHRGSDETTG